MAQSLFKAARAQNALAAAAETTECKRLEEALRISEERNRDLVENAAYGVFRASLDGVLLEVNPAFLRMLGCSGPEDALASNLMRDIFRYPEDWARMAAACREQGNLRGVETEWRRRDGCNFAVRLNLRRASLDGAAEGLEGIAEDVAELRAMERQLRQAQKFEAIGQLAGGVAHDFNNVVGAILGWAELGVEQAKSAPGFADKFTHIREQAERAAALTSELFAFARRQVLQPAALDLNALVARFVGFLDKVIGENIELKRKHAPLEPVCADETQIEQVLMNLCLNARDAMPDGGRLIVETGMADLDEAYCRFYSYASPGRHAVLSVSDTGIGMNAETRERVFEPLFTTKEVGKGAGMGLATVHGIVKQHGGFIHLYSEPGQGSLFRVYLPAMVHGGALPSSRGSPASPPAAVTGGSETILLAEDHDSIREMARQALLKLGYRVLCAADGEEALRLSEAEAPALAVLDVVMPKLGGVATATKLRERNPKLPILFTSGYALDPLKHSVSGPPASYLQKPYSPAALGRLIRESLDLATRERESPVT